MNPHSSDHTRTKEGYLIAIEELLNLDKNLPKSFYRLDIETARDLYNAIIVSGKIGFIEKCTELDLNTEGIF
jgi:hypothetical protein